MRPTIFNLELNTHEEDGQTIAELDIDGIIGFDWWSMEDQQNTKEEMRKQLRQVREIQAEKIVVNISSLGGDVDHGLAIHDLLASNDAEVETRVIGMTASAATIIAQAGEVRSMSDNALYLVHRAWTIGMGNANDFEALANDLNKLDELISNIYAKRSDKDQSDFMDLMNEANGDGIWITASEALDYGLIDSVTEPMKAAALDKAIFEKYNIPKPPKDKQERIGPINISIDAKAILEAANVLKKPEKSENKAVSGQISAAENCEYDENNNLTGCKRKEAVPNVSAASRERAKLQLLKLKT